MAGYLAIKGIAETRTPANVHNEELRLVFLSTAVPWPIKKRSQTVLIPHEVAVRLTVACT